jgi:hypothetical protein
VRFVPCSAVQAVKTFIRSPDIFQCDFWELPAVQQLSQDKSATTLLQLLDVMLQGDLQGKGVEYALGAAVFDFRRGPGMAVQLSAAPEDGFAGQLRPRVLVS